MKIKTHIFSLALAIIAWGGVSCSPDHIDDQQKKTPVSLRVVRDEPRNLVSRAIVPVEDKIFNAVVMVFTPTDVLFSIKYFTVWGTPQAATGVDEIDISDVIVGLDLDQHYTIYVAANVGHSDPANANSFSKYFNFVGLESDAYYHYLTMPSINNNLVQVDASTYAMAMSYAYTTTGAESGVVELHLQRVQSKVNWNVALGASASPDLHILGVRFSSMSHSTYLFQHPQDMQLSNNEYIVSDWLEPAIDERSASGTVYLFENRKGNGPDKNEPTNAVASPANATYMEILADSCGKQFYCKVYLGTDAVTNYDLMRNCRYTVTATINGTQNMESDVRRVAIYDDEWYTTDGLMLHYDGIYNNGIEKNRVTNYTAKTVADPAAYLNYISGSGYPVGYTIPVTYDTPETIDARNRWKNIAPATEGNFNLVLSRFTFPQTAAPSDGWGPDCLILGGTTAATETVASVEYNDDRLRPQQFTIEVIFNSDPGKNVSTKGNDLYGFLDNVSSQPYVVAGVEAYDAGFGFIAGTTWNGKNYSASAGAGVKRSVVLQFDGTYLLGYYGNKLVYKEEKRKVGPITWPTAAVGSRCNNAASTCTQLTFGKYYRCDKDVQYFGKIYAFRFYNRLLSRQEMTDNFNLDTFRFGLPAPE